MRQVLLCAALVATGLAQAETEHFSGPYLGVEAGFQNVFSGALIQGVDVLDRSTQAATSLLGGWRYQWSSGWTFGLEAQYGWVDGDLSHMAFDGALDIEYSTDDQRSLGLLLGHTLGDAGRWHLFGYAFESAREFDIRIMAPSGLFTQRDKQEFIRFGIGIEGMINHHWHWRGTVGVTDVDISIPTNIEPDRGVELMVGLVRQF